LKMESLWSESTKVTKSAKMTQTKSIQWQLNTNVISKKF
jgi:hypothetical protein